VRRRQRQQADPCGDTALRSDLRVGDGGERRAVQVGDRPLELTPRAEGDADVERPAARRRGLPVQPGAAFIAMRPRTLVRSGPRRSVARTQCLTSADGDFTWRELDGSLRSPRLSVGPCAVTRIQVGRGAPIPILASDLADLARPTHSRIQVAAHGGVVATATQNECSAEELDHACKSAPRGDTSGPPRRIRDRIERPFRSGDLCVFIFVTEQRE
jgi:hypothetical protein